jgi:hypothetical protein
MPEKQKDDQTQAPVSGETPTNPAIPAQDPNAQPVDGTQQPVVQPEPRKLDETVPGGKYTTADGRVVNANNEPIKE